MPRDMDDQEILGIVKKVALWGGISLVTLTTVLGSYYTVNQNEVGAVTRFGQLVSSAPTSPGLHLKAPFIDTAHTIRVSIEKIPIPEVKAKTIDNQFVKIDLNLSYHTGDPFRALFKVGDVGAESIHDKLIPYVQSRTLDEIGRVSALEITDRKGAIEASILKDVKTSVLEMFGESVDDVQIIGINYDPSFEANVQEMVKTRNQQVSSKNMLAVKETEALQNVAVAKGLADAAVATAEGEKQREIKKAEADARRAELMGTAQASANLAVKTAEAEGIRKVGDAEAGVIREKIDAAGGGDSYASILRAEASKNWNGTVPQYQLGGGANATAPFMMLNPKN